MPCDRPVYISMSCKRYGSRLAAEYCMYRPCRWLARVPRQVIYTEVLDTWAACQHLACLFFHEPPRGFRPLVIWRTYNPWSMLTPNRCVLTSVPNFLEQKYTYETHLFNIYHAWQRGREMHTPLL